jgi:uncharacterized protein YqeY
MTEPVLKARIQEDMKSAMRAQDKQRLSVIRLILAAIKQIEVDERIVLTDSQVLTVLDKMVKQRRESIMHFEQASRQDLVDKEVFEVEVICTYLPEPLAAAEVTRLITQAIAELGAQSVKDMGKVMQHIKPHVEGRVDMKIVGEQVKQLLH